MQFLEFINRKQRETQKHLKLIEKLLQKGGLKASGHLDQEDPFIFVKNTKEGSFEGIRIYEIGEMIAYRVQNEERTEPFGKAYILDLEDIFSDFMSENMKEEEAGHRVVKVVSEELNKFFKKSFEAEQELLDKNDEKIGLFTRPSSEDLSAQIGSKN